VERPPDMKVSCEYGNKQSRTKTQVALQQGIVPGSCPARVSGEDNGSRLLDSASGRC